MKKLFQSVVVALATVFAVSSCGSGILADITNQQDVDALYTTATADYKDANILKLTVFAKEPLEEGLKGLEVIYKDKEDDTFCSQYVYPNGKYSDPEVEKFKKNEYEKMPERAFADFTPFADVKKLKEEAVALTEEGTESQFEGYTLNRLEAVSTADGVERFVVITATKKGEAPKRKGRTIETSYYEFKFQILEDGTLEYVEN